MTAPPLTAVHPLDPLTAGEIEQAVRAAREGLEDAVVVSAFLDEPSRAELRTGTPQRRAAIVLYDGATVHEVLVAGDRRLAARPVPGAVPPIGRAELEAAAEAVKADPRWIAAVRARGVTELEHVIVQPWPPGQADPPGRRLAKALTFVGTRPGDNIYARPVEGLLATVDLDSTEVLEVEDDGVVAIPPTAGDHYEHTPARDDLKPLEIVQPEGPSFTLDGHALRWLNWSLHVGFTPREGIVLHRLAGMAGRCASRLAERDVGALRRPGARAPHQAGVRRGRGGARRAGQPAAARLRLPRRDPLSRRRPRRPGRRAGDDPERDLHP